MKKQKKKSINNKKFKKLKNNFKLILFDFDGVLIDSRKNMELSWKNVQNKTGSRVKFIKYFNKIGEPFKNILKKIKFDKDYDHARQVYEKSSINHFNKIKLFPYAKILLRKLSKKYIICLITSKSKNRTKKIIKKFNSKFKHTFCPEDKFRGKPNLCG